MGIGWGPRDMPAGDYHHDDSSLTTHGYHHPPPAQSHPGDQSAASILRSVKEQVGTSAYNIGNKQNTVLHIK